MANNMMVHGGKYCLIEYNTPINQDNILYSFVQLVFKRKRMYKCPYDVCTIIAEWLRHTVGRNVTIHNKKIVTNEIILTIKITKDLIT